MAARAPASMSVETHRVDGTSRILIAGEVDVSTEREFALELFAALAGARGRAVVIDVSALQFASVACVDLLADVVADPLRRVIAVVGLSPLMVRTWTLLGHASPPGQPVSLHEPVVAPSYALPRGA